MGGIARVSGFDNKESDELRNFNVFSTASPFVALHKVSRKGDRIIVSSRSPHLRLASHVDSLSHLMKALSFEPRMIHR